MHKFNKHLKITLCLFLSFNLFVEIIAQVPFTNGKFLLPLENSFFDTTKIISKEICCAHSFTILEQGPNTNEKTAKFTLFNLDPIVNSGVRSEIAFKPEKKVKVDRWYGFDIYLPTDYAIDTIPEVLAQWHEIPDFYRGENWRTPPISLWNQGNHWYLHILWSSDTVNTNRTAHTEIYDLGKLEKGRWIPWVFHIKFSWETDGQLEIWQNNKKVFNKNGPNAYNDRTGNYFKIGIYKWMWNTAKERKISLANKREVYYKNIRIGNEKQNYILFNKK